MEAAGPFLPYYADEDLDEDSGNEIGDDIRWPEEWEVNTLVEHDDYSEDSFP